MDDIIVALTAAVVGGVGGVTNQDSCNTQKRVAKKAYVLLDSIMPKNVTIHITRPESSNTDWCYGVSLKAFSSHKVVFIRCVDGFNGAAAASLFDGSPITMHTASLFNALRREWR